MRSAWKGPATVCRPIQRPIARTPSALVPSALSPIRTSAARVCGTPSAPEVAAPVCTEFLSNDLCDDAKSISGQGTFNFDNSAAATDGLAHRRCTSGGTDLIEHDLWFRWTSPCTDTVFVRTCGQAGAIDTKLAVYDGVACLPGDDAAVGLRRRSLLPRLHDDLRGPGHA